MVRVGTGEADWAARVARRIFAEPRRGRRVRVVSVEGHSGSGKSTVAERVRRELVAIGEPVVTLTMEDLYPGWEGLEQAPELLRTWVLEPLTEGRSAAWRRYDWERGAFEDRWRSLPEELADGGTLLVEGCGSGAGVVRDSIDVLVWVTAPAPLRRARLDAREDADLYAPFRALWARQEESLYSRDHPRERADLVIENP